MRVYPLSCAAVAIALFLQANVVSAQALLPTGTSDHSRERPTHLPNAAAPMQARELEMNAVALPRLSSAFGARRDPLGQGIRIHHGIDIPAPWGTPVRAAATGQVRLAAARGGYGLMVEVAHSDGLATRYAHLSRILVVPGQQVREGEPIALVGSTGRSTGNHLHFEVRRHGMALDPVTYLTRVVPDARFDLAPLTSGQPHVSAFARARNAALSGAGQ